MAAMNLCRDFLIVIPLILLSSVGQVKACTAEELTEMCIASGQDYCSDKETHEQCILFEGLMCDSMSIPTVLVDQFNKKCDEELQYRCSPEKQQECLNIYTDANVEGTESLCPAIEDVKNCLKEMLPYCDDGSVMMDSIESTIRSYSQYDVLCNVACSNTKLSECYKKFPANPNEHKGALICGPVLETRSCLMDLKKECESGGDVATMVDSMLATVNSDQFNEICAPHPEPPTCSMKTYMRCMGDFPSIRDEDHLLHACKVLPFATLCIQNLIIADICPEGELKDRLNSIHDRLMKYTAICEPSIEPVCTQESKNYCKQMLEKYAFDMENYCGFLPLAKMCMAAIVSFCGDHELYEGLVSEITTELRLLRSYDLFCRTLESPDENCTYNEFYNCTYNLMPTTVEDAAGLTQSAFCHGRREVIRCVGAMMPNCTVLPVRLMMAATNRYNWDMQRAYCLPYVTGTSCARYVAMCLKPTQSYIDDGTLTRHNIGEICPIASVVECITSNTCNNEIFQTFVDEQIHQLEALEPLCDLVDPESSCYLDHLEGCVADLPRTQEEISTTDITHLCGHISDVETCINNFADTCFANVSSAPGMTEVMMVFAGAQTLCYSSEEIMCSLSTFQECVSKVREIESMNFNTNKEMVCRNQKKADYFLDMSVCKEAFGEDYAQNITESNNHHEHTTSSTGSEHHVDSTADTGHHEKTTSRTDSEHHGDAGTTDSSHFDGTTEGVNTGNEHHGNTTEGVDTGNEHHGNTTEGVDTGNEHHGDTTEGVDTGNEHHGDTTDGHENGNENDEHTATPKTDNEHHTQSTVINGPVSEGNLVESTTSGNGIGSESDTSTRGDGDDAAKPTLCLSIVIGSLLVWKIMYKI